MELTEKQQQYNSAMDKYEKMPVYIWIGRAVSFVNVGSQVLLGVLVFKQSIGPVKEIVAFVAAYIFADFVNGLAHMYMDNADDYESQWGPLIAAFHLHHRTPAYKIKPLIAVYCHESGSKIWLAVLHLIVVPAVWLGGVTGAVARGLFYFSVLSSIAEVSHYLCHVPNANAFERFLGRARILMSMRYHIREHHTKDNINYAFLNSMTDPVIDFIAKIFYTGYKATTDTHYVFYAGVGTENREH